MNKNEQNKVMENKIQINKWIPNFQTKDGWFLVSLDKTILSNEKPPEGPYNQNKEITVSKITVYNTNTKMFSEKSLYYNEEKGYYFKGNNSYWNKSPHSKYYIDDLQKT